MKQKIKRISIFTFFGAVLFLNSSCVSEEHLHNEENLKYFNKKVSLNDLPDLQNKINAKRIANKSTAKSGEIDYLSLINTENVQLIEEANGNKNYTFSLNLKEENKLTNLVIHQIGTDFQYKIISYSTPNIEQWIADNIDLGYSNTTPSVEIGDLNKVGGACFVTTYTCPSGQHSFGNSADCIYYFSQFTFSVTEVPCADGSGNQGDNSGSGYIGGGYPAGNNSTPILTNPNPPCDPRVDCPILDLIIETPCEQLKNMNSRPIVNTTSSKTILDNLNDLNTQMATNPRERMYVIRPTTLAEEQFSENLVQGPLNGASGDFDLGDTAITALMHCHYNTSLLSIFSLADIYQIYQLQNSQFLLNNGQTFTSYLVTAHGTKYAIKFAPPISGSQTPYNEFFFIGWDFDNIKKTREDKYEENVNLTNTPAQNELGFLKFLKEQNLGVEIYKADNSFSQWSKTNIKHK